MADACARRAWLELADGRTLALEDEAAGYFCTSLDLGYPEVREVVNALADQHGVDDRSQYFGGRVISAEISAVAGARAIIDEVAASFAPYMVPAARPVLHYVLERPGNPERVIGVRAAGYAWPIAGPYQRTIHLQWFAADPIVRDPAVQSVAAWSGASVQTGRRYPLTFDREYPPGGGIAITGRIEHDGDLDARPTLRVYGPITGARTNFGSYSSGAYLGGAIIEFAPTFTIDAGHFVEIDTAAYTARIDGDPTRPVEHFLVWSTLRWPTLPPRPAYSLMNLTGTTTTAVSQVQAMWQDGFLT